MEAPCVLLQMGYGFRHKRDTSGLVSLSNNKYERTSCVQMQIGDLHAYQFLHPGTGVVQQCPSGKRAWNLGRELVVFEPFHDGEGYEWHGRTDRMIDGR